MAEPHPIFEDIDDSALEAVKQRVLADPTVLDELYPVVLASPLLYAIRVKEPDIALWIVEHRGQHDVNVRTRSGDTALHMACIYSPLPFVRMLVDAGADPSLQNANGTTPLMVATLRNDIDIVAFLLGLPAVKASIDAMLNDVYTALKIATVEHHLPIAQLLLDAGADPTIPDGVISPLALAIEEGHTDTAALLRQAIAPAERARFLLKARAIVDAAISPSIQQGRAARGEALPRVELAPQLQQQQQQQGQDGRQRFRVVAAFVLGLGEGEAMLPEHFEELMGYMARAAAPAWEGLPLATGALAEPTGARVQGMRSEEHIKQDGLSRLNAMGAAELRTELLRICGSKAWAERVARTFPHTTPDGALQAMDQVWWSLGRSDYLEAFAAHPRIGDAAALRKKFEAAAAAAAGGGEAKPSWEAGEQKGVEGAKEETLQELADFNKRYEERFGYIFLVCATGKTAEEMLALLKARMGNEADAELKVAAGEQGKITVLRLNKLLLALGEEKQEGGSRL